MLNVRLNKKLEEKLKQYVAENDISKTDVVKEALALYFTKEELSQNPYELGQDLFGAAASQHTDLSTTYKSKLNEKYSH